MSYSLWHGDSEVKIYWSFFTTPGTHKMEATCQPHYICVDNLLGQCSKQSLCDQSHRSRPYMWQYKYKDSTTESRIGNSWKSFTESENEVIERQFCDVNITVARMKDIMISTPPDVL